LSFCLVFWEGPTVSFWKKDAQKSPQYPKRETFNSFSSILFAPLPLHLPPQGRKQNERQAECVRLNLDDNLRWFRRAVRTTALWLQRLPFWVRNNSPKQTMTPSFFLFSSILFAPFPLHLPPQGRKQNERQAECVRLNLGDNLS